MALKVNGQEVDDDESDAEGTDDPVPSTTAPTAATQATDAKDTADELVRLTREGPPFLKDLWALASATYALQARDEVTVVQTPKKNAEGGGYMWKRVEQQVLTKMLRQNLVSFGAVIVKETNPGDQ